MEPSDPMEVQVQLAMFQFFFSIMNSMLTENHVPRDEFYQEHRQRQ